MATRVKNKIQKLLRQLDQDVDSLPGDDLGLLQTATSGAQAEDLELTPEARRRVAARANSPDDASSFDGASESVVAFAASFSISEARLVYDENIQSSSPSAGTSAGTTPVPRPMPTLSPPGPKRAPHTTSNSIAAAANAEKVAVLERKVMALMAENRKLQASFSEAMTHKNAEVAELQAHLAGTVRELTARHHELEAAAPLLRLRLEDLRAQLADLKLSDTAAAELRLVPREARTAVDEVRLAVHDTLSESRRETELLRSALAGARETAARAEEVAARAKAEAARHAAATAERERDLALVSEGMQARIDRLASELESAMVGAQLNAAKGALYEELRAKVDEVVAENQRLAVVEATYKKLEAQAAADRSVASQKEHTFEMLMMDKAYLSKQVDFLADQQRKLEAELELREKKLNELSRQKNEMFERLMAAETLKGRNEEVRLQKELAALQERTHADLEKIRVETAEAYEREARLLRELRDGAAVEAARAQTALSELQGLHERSQISHTEVVRRMEQQIVALQTETKQKSFELSHFKVVVAEKEQLVGRTNMQVELLQDKLSVLMDKYRTLEVEHNAQVTRTLKEAAAGGGGGSTTILSGPEAGGGGGTQANTQLQVDYALLKQERDSLAREVELLGGRLAAAQDSLRLASQPHAFLIEELESIKARATRAETKLAALQAALQARDAEVEALTAERDALRGDLDALLSQRQALDTMRAVVVKALGGGLPQVHHAAASAALSGAPRKAPGPVMLSGTTIIGEGTPLPQPGP